MRELTVERYQSKRKKPGTTARYRAKRKRADDAVCSKVREKCVDRDGYCRFSVLGGCEGPSAHCHLGRLKRARTRGMAPTLRHTTAGSCMGCQKHHALEESGQLAVSMFADLGADGPMRLDYQGQIAMSPAC